MDSGITDLFFDGPATSVILRYCFNARFYNQNNTQVSLFLDWVVVLLYIFVLLSHLIKHFVICPFCYVERAYGSLYTFQLILS